MCKAHKYNECEATNEIKIFSLHKINKWHIHDKNLNFVFTIFNFMHDIFFALNDVIHVRTLDRRHINDVA